jgi:hypothetical protein
MPASLTVPQSTYKYHFHFYLPLPIPCPLPLPLPFPSFSINYRARAKRYHKIPNTKKPWPRRNLWAASLRGGEVSTFL